MIKIHTYVAQRSKFDARACKNVFLSFEEGMQGYVLYDLVSHQLLVSRNFILFESHFFFSPFFFISF